MTEILYRRLDRPSHGGYGCMEGITKRIGALALFGLLLGGGCAPRPAPVSAPSRTATLSCQDIEGLDPLLASRTVLLLGEMHGTTESPAFLANAACLALRAGRPVTVALEIPREEQSRLEAFLASAGTEGNRAALLARPFWGAEYQDGRRSQAMLSMLEELRRLHQQGRPLRVKLVDRMAAPAVPAERDRWMAEGLAQAFDETPEGVVIALMGNLHVRVSRGTPWDPNYEPAGFVLVNRRSEIHVTSLDVSYQGGSAWVCTSSDPSSCGARPVHGRADARSGRVVLNPQVTNGYHGVYEVGMLTASSPAQGPATTQ
jgi:hypothetical protein